MGEIEMTEGVRNKNEQYGAEINRLFHWKMVWFFYPVRMFLLRIKRKVWRIGSHLKRRVLFLTARQD